eukprot:1153389-Pelagomonas_calceolata.AAC.3
MTLSTACWKSTAMLKGGRGSWSSRQSSNVWTSNSSWSRQSGDLVKTVLCIAGGISCSRHYCGLLPAKQCVSQCCASLVALVAQSKAVRCQHSSGRECLHRGQQHSSVEAGSAACAHRRLTRAHTDLHTHTHTYILGAHSFAKLAAQLARTEEAAKRALVQTDVTAKGGAAQKLLDAERALFKMRDENVELRGKLSRWVSQAIYFWVVALRDAAAIDGKGARAYTHTHPHTYTHALALPMLGFLAGPPSVPVI